MDATPMFPMGWHPQRPHRSPDAATPIGRGRSRTAVGGVKYYFIDFGISSYDQDSVLGFDGQERAPELSQEVPYSPYKLDVYILGMVYENFLIDVSAYPTVHTRS